MAEEFCGHLIPCGDEPTPCQLPKGHKAKRAARKEREKAQQEKEAAEREANRCVHGATPRTACKYKGCHGTFG